jgi:hypothetical protein
MWRAALIWAALSSVVAGALPGAVGITHRVGPVSVSGAIMAHDASETMSPRCPRVPPPKWVSIALELA